MKSAIYNITKFLYLLLAAFPLMKENINSIVILLCTLFMIYDRVRSKENFKLSKKIVLYTLLFWIFFFYQIISFQFNTKIILLHLPFLIFPLIFYYRPKYINARIKGYSILTFQISTAIQSIYYITLFLLNNSSQKLFTISNENIPLFRDYVFRNAYFETHPTYFSIFLLISFTISFLYIINKNLNEKITIFHVLNLLFTVFLIFLLSSKMVILILALTIITLFFILIKKLEKRMIFFSFLTIMSVTIIGSFFFKDIISKRFIEITTEINKPIVDDYHNSTNIRVAIFKCSIELIKEVPIIGYGENLQEHLDRCYAQNNDSDFYKISTYNTHNYYFNLILYGGYALLLLFIVYVTFILKASSHSTLAIIIIIQLLIINFTENYFSRHYGIVTFNYFIFLLLFFKNEKIET